MTQLLHGVPIEKWVGRWMKSNRDGGKKGSQNRHPVRVISFFPKTGEAQVIPGGHKQPEIVPISQLLPWWSENDDLRNPNMAK